MEVPAHRGCHDHPQVEALLRCGQCDHDLCDACWTHTHQGRPCCLPCASEAETRSFRRWSWVVTFLGLAAGTGVQGWWSGWWTAHPWYGAFGALGVVAIVGWLIHRAATRGGEASLALRSADDAPPDEPVAASHPYRARLGRLGARFVPRVSGKVTTLLVLISLTLCAVLFPAVLHLPRWLEAEVVLGGWWLTLALTLGALRYRGVRVVDDFRFRLTGWGSPARPRASSSGGSGDWLSLGAIEGEVVILALVLGLLLGASFLLAEVVLPLLFMAIYWALHLALVRVGSDRQDHEGRPGRALGWGLLWATVYVAPLALAVAALHRMP